MNLSLFEQYKTTLIKGLSENDGVAIWKAITHELNAKGYSKLEIYQLFLSFHQEIQTDPVYSSNESYYNKLSDFLDGFTSWGKSQRILPEQPDVN